VSEFNIGCIFFCTKIANNSNNQSSYLQHPRVSVISFVLISAIHMGLGQYFKPWS